MKLIGAPALVLLAGAGVSHTDRIEGLRAVERGRYAFTLNATRPFDEVYPRSVFEKKVQRQEEEERVLRERFGLKVTPELLLKDYERIERETRAPEQWEAIKQALGGDRKRIEEIFCRPLLVERALRARFDFDPKIHAVPHQKARQARASFLEGKIPSGAKKLRLARKPEAMPSTEDLLRKAQAEASVPRVLAPGKPEEADPRLSLDPEMARVLEKELQKPGDVTTILEERDRFSVFRLEAMTEEQWTVAAVQIPKRDFDGWFEAMRKTLSRRKK